MGRLAEGLQIDPDHGCSTRQYRHASQIRRTQPGRAEAPRRCGRAVAALLKASKEVYAETAAKNADFKKIYEAMSAFRGDEYLWFQIAEYSYDNFLIRARAANQL